MDYSFTEHPDWREGNASTSQLVDEVVAYSKQYEQLPEKAKSFCKEHFSAAVTVDFIHHLNIGELVGTQSKEETKDVLQPLLSIKNVFSYRDPPRAGTNAHQEIVYARQTNQETQNTFFAMRKLSDLRQQMNGSTLLTVPLICEVHRWLMTHLHSGAGTLRTTEVYTRHSNSNHFYPSPDKAKQQLYTLIDYHNIYVTNSPPEETSKEHITYVFKCAARLLFEFVSTHPFSDGNGRMCRLLANNVLAHISPFPVGLYHTNELGRNSRTDYIEAIVKCRESPEVGPGDLAALLVEGALKSWKSLFCNLEKLDLVEPGVRIGPIVVQKCKMVNHRVHCTEISKHVDRILACFNKERVCTNKEEIIREIEYAVQEADVDPLKPCQCVQIKAKIQSVTVTVDVFP